MTHTTPEVEDIDVSTYAESFHSRIAHVWEDKQATRDEIELTLESIISTITAKHQAELERAMVVKHFAWCPQCGDALEQSGTDNIYSCFGCGDVQYSLTPAKTDKQTTI